MSRPRLPLTALAPSAFKKNRNRNLAMGLPMTEPDIAEIDLTTPPATLTPAAVEVWHTIAPHVAHVVKATDALLLCQLCEAYSELQEDLETVRTDGRVVTCPMSGKLLKHPLLAEISTKRQQIVTISAQFGLSPSSRRNVTPLVEKEEKDEFADV